MYHCDPCGTYSTVPGGKLMIVRWGDIQGSITSQIDLWAILTQKANLSQLAQVAFSGDYLDLKNRPSITGSQNLQQVTDRGNVTTDSIIIGGLTVNGAGAFSSRVSGLPGISPDDFATISQIITGNLILTTSGTTGIATLIEDILNIPNYTYTLPEATTNSLGGVIVGENISVSGGTIYINQGDIIAALGFTPYNATNPDGFISGITAIMIDNALGYIPYSSANPAGYISGNQTIVLSGAVSGTGTTSIVTTIEQGLLPVPGGSNTDIQFNSNGSFGGSNLLTWNGSELFVSGNTQIGSLASTGTTMVVAGPSGVLSTEPILTIPTLRYQTVERNTVAATQRGILNFSTQFNVTDDSGNASTDVSISGITASIVSGLATVATTGLYSSLIGTPSIPVPGGSNTDIQFNSSGTFGGSKNLVWNNTSNYLLVTGNTGIGQATPAAPLDILQIVGGSGATSAINIASTWNTTGKPTGLLINITNTASATGSALMAVEVGGVPKLTVLNNGNVLINNATDLGIALSVNGQINSNGNTITGNQLVATSQLLSPEWIDRTLETSITLASGAGTLTGSFTASSGSANYAALTINPTINQSGSASGILRGLYINPTLTSTETEFLAISIGAGTISCAASTTTYSSLNIPTGAAPTTPKEGDMWKTGTHLFIYLNGTTTQIV